MTRWPNFWAGFLLARNPLAQDWDGWGWGMGWQLREPVLHPLLSDCTDHGEPEGGRRERAGVWMALSAERDTVCQKGLVYHSNSCYFLQGALG